MVVLLVSIGLAGYFTLRALAPLMTVSGLHAPSSARFGVLGAWAVGMLLVHWTLRSIASFDVRDSSLYTGFYDVMGLAWIAVSIAVLHRLDLSLRDDVIERRNPAALYAIGGATLGLAMTYAGGNVGDGPGWWCVVAASGIGTIALFACWIALAVLAGANESITIDRDSHVGIRVGALLAACGLVFGRAAAGDWISLRDTVSSFVLAAWPAAILLGLAVFVERALATRPRQAPRGVALALGPALVYVAAAVAVVRWQGHPG